MTDPDLEARLRAHFAERAEHEPLEPSDPDRIVAAARAGGGAGGRVIPLAHPRRGWRIAEVAGAAAACLLAVVAIVADDDERDRTDISDDPATTVTTERPEPPPTTVAETTPTTPAPEVTVPPTAPGGATVVAVPLGLLGGWDGASWQPAPVPPAAAPVRGGEPFQLLGLDQPPATVSAPPPGTSGCGPVDEVYAVDIFGAPETAAPVAVSGVASPVPRPVTRLDPTEAAHRSAAAEVLAAIGVQTADSQVRQVVRADLEGDGVDEVLVVAEQVDRDTLVARPGDYSVLFLRRMVGGTVRDTVIASGQYAEESAYILTHDVAAVADLNGDGQMEVVVRDRYYEGGATTVYELRSDRAVEVLALACGA